MTVEKSGDIIGSVNPKEHKNRIRIPKRFRDAFPEGEKLFFMKYTKGCIAVYPESSLNARLALYDAVKSDRPELQASKRVIMASIKEVEEDGQGRAVLPAAMRQHAGISKEVVTLGMGDYLEIWSPEGLAAVMQGYTLEDALGIMPM